MTLRAHILLTWPVGPPGAVNGVDGGARSRAFSRSRPSVLAPQSSIAPAGPPPQSWTEGGRPAGPPPRRAVGAAPTRPSSPMASGNGSSSSNSPSGDMKAVDYAPDRCHDPTFHGIAVGCAEVCRGHNLEPQRCVAFEGTNTGRRFYMCPIQNEDLNCGFVSWVDDQEWSETLQNALSTLWSMYNESNSSRIDERVEHGKLLALVAGDKCKAEKKYRSLMADVGKLLDDSHKKVMEQNFALLKGKTDFEVVEMEKERDSLKIVVEMLKQVQKTEAAVMKSKEHKWEEERKALNDEKKKLEHMLYDLFKAGYDNKEKLKRIKAIVDE